jgi:hypothetical protein
MTIVARAAVEIEALFKLGPAQQEDHRNFSIPKRIPEMELFSPYRLRACNCL